MWIMRGIKIPDSILSHTKIWKRRSNSWLIHFWMHIKQSYVNMMKMYQFICRKVRHRSTNKHGYLMFIKAIVIGVLQLDHWNDVIIILCWKTRIWNLYCINKHSLPTEYKGNNLSYQWWSNHVFYRMKIKYRFHFI